MSRTLFFPIYRSGFSALGIFRARDFRVSQNRVSIENPMENRWKTWKSHWRNGVGAFRAADCSVDFRDD